MSDVVLWLDVIADVSAVLAALAVLLTTRFVWRQVSLQAATQDKDERRFLRESINIIHDTLQGERFREARTLFFAGAHKEEYSALETEQRSAARYVLSVYGLLARMVRHNAIDEEVLRDYWYASLIRDWERLENFISGERLRSKNHTLFSDTQVMVSRWQKA